MYKRLILFRHGKSDWGTDAARDHDRPLAQRGVKAAQQMGQWLAIAQQCPDQVITSSAVRAKSTAELAAQSGAWGCPIEVTGTLYEATPKTVLTVIQACPDPVQTLLLVGHEPTWSELTSLLMGGGTVRFPTAAMACLDFEVESWRQVRFRQGQLLWLLPPKSLAGSVGS